MNTNQTRGVTLVALLMTTASTTQANDIVNFLNDHHGNSGPRNAPVVVQPVENHGHGRGRVGYGNQGHGGRGQGVPFRGSETHRPPVNTVNLRPNRNVALRHEG